jgi:hypothetical protein
MGQDEFINNKESFTEYYEWTLDDEYHWCSGHTTLEHVHKRPKCATLSIFLFLFVFWGFLLFFFSVLGLNSGPIPFSHSTSPFL